MGLRTFFRNKIEQLILGNLASGLAAGRYGTVLKKTYLFGKGYMTWTGVLLAMFFTAAAQFDNTGASTVLATVSMILAGLGLVRKGAHLTPPTLPADLRHELHVGLSIVTWVLGLTQGYVSMCAEKVGSVCGLSDEVQMATITLTAVSGFLATYLADPPKPS